MSTVLPTFCCYLRAILTTTLCSSWPAELGLDFGLWLQLWQRQWLKPSANMGTRSHRPSGWSRGSAGEAEGQRLAPAPALELAMCARPPHWPFFSPHFAVAAASALWHLTDQFMIIVGTTMAIAASETHFGWRNVATFDIRRSHGADLFTGI